MNIVKKNGWDLMFSMGGVPEWFYLLAIAVVITIIIINEWWTR